MALVVVKHWDIRDNALSKQEKEGEGKVVGAKELSSVYIIYMVDSVDSKDHLAIPGARIEIV